MRMLQFLWHYLDSRILAEIVLNRFAPASLPADVLLHTAENYSCHSIEVRFLEAIPLETEKLFRVSKVKTIWIELGMFDSLELTFHIRNSSYVIFCR